VSEDVTRGELPPTRAARRAADQAASRRRRRNFDLGPALRRLRRPGTAKAVPAIPAAGRSVAAAVPPAGNAAAASVGSSRRHARVVATVLVVPALVGTIALPAYATVQSVGFDTSDEFNMSRAEAQNVDVSSLAGGIIRSNDGYAVQTKAEIDAEAARVAAAQRSAALDSVGERAGAYSTPTQQAEGDDYPWWSQATDNAGGGLSPLRYYYRECVDFVAWRLNRDAGVTSGPFKWDWGNLASGSAYRWADEWAARGRQTSSTPIVGSVAWFRGNHVAYVQAVHGDGTVTLEEYNWGNDHAYHTRTIPASDVALFLYPPA
jgi:surface antigen